jgi:hypothetical protein
MKRGNQTLKLHKETLYTLTAADGLGWVAGGDLRSVKAGCLTEQDYCNTERASCPGNCVTDDCASRIC